MKAYSLSLRRALERPEVRGKLLILLRTRSLPGGIYFMDFAGMPEARAIITLCKKQNSKI